MPDEGSMKHTVDVIYDGEVLRPQGPVVGLEPNTRYRVTIETGVSGSNPPEKAGVLLRVAELAQDLGVPDLAEQHDHYLYGTPKR